MAEGWLVQSMKRLWPPMGTKVASWGIRLRGIEKGNENEGEELRRHK
jgi:hypothetical protein